MATNLRNKWFYLLCTLALGLSGAAICSGQVSRAEITGLVTDQTQALVPGADVIVMNTATRTEWKTQTNRSGQY